MCVRKGSREQRSRYLVVELPVTCGLTTHERMYFSLATGVDELKGVTSAGANMDADTYLERLTCIL